MIGPDSWNRCAIQRGAMVCLDMQIKFWQGNLSLLALPDFCAPNFPTSHSLRKDLDNFTCRARAHLLPSLQKSDTRYVRPVRP